MMHPMKRTKATVVLTENDTAELAAQEAESYQAILEGKTRERQLRE